MKHPFVDFLIHLLLALMLLAMLAVGIVLMLIFTAVDGAARIYGKLKKAKGA